MPFFADTEGFEADNQEEFGEGGVEEENENGPGQAAV